MDDSSAQQRPSRCGQLFKSLLLVTHMVGIEACVAFEVILMIANLQTLGVPIRFSSLPGTVAATFGIVLIPTLGFIMDKLATSRRAKAIILVCTTSFQVAGTFFIFIGNAVKLLYHDKLTPSNSTWWNVTTEESLTTKTEWPNETLLSVMGITATEYPRIGPTSNISLLLTTQFESSTTELPTEEAPIQYFAILAMVGYALIDCGYDSSNCFLKTFALASTPPEDHSNIIVRSILVSSLGGCLIAVLGSVGLGNLLTVGTMHDSNAAQCAFLSALCFVLLLSGLTTTLTSGFCCTNSVDSLESDTEEPVVETSNEKSKLIASSNSLHKSTSKADEKDPRLFFASGGYTFENPQVIDHADLTEHKGIVGFIRRQKKQIILNIATFFLIGALYSYEVYVVNFVGEGIFNGDPNAKVTTQEYKDYLKGIEVGSSGILIIYVMFIIGSLCQEMLLRRIGWKLEMIIACSGFVAVNVVCAVLSTLWSYYVTAAWTGLYRAVVVTVPYILANQFALEQSDDQNTGVAIAVVASMLPCGFTVCSAIMGPLIDLTGNPATPVYYTVVSAFLGLITILFLKSES
ncbi:unnamed protein product [Lymnaea stagnalis]|uniref:Uncharacterized protein n=1 Tax=Lymnaea stagnalis TaxID=6523 RepID=A0AAV2HYI6_LYMST